MKIESSASLVQSSVATNRIVTRIVLSDEDEHFRTSLSRLLQAIGHEVREVCNERQTVSVLSQTSIDLAIIDVPIPAKDFSQRIEEIRSRWPALKLIIISAGGFCEMCQRTVKTSQGGSNENQPL